MKQTFPWLIAVVCVGVVIGMLVARGSTPGSTRADLSQIPRGVGPAAVAPGDITGTVVHTFDDDNNMREFITLWQQRQGIFLHMDILQGYWNGEQTTLAQLNDQLLGEYGVDSAKNYRLDTDERVLIETAAAVGEGEEGGEVEEKTIYEFDDEEGMTTFGNMWQQRQGVIVRMTVLQAYWNNEQNKLAQLNNKLSVDYDLDPTKPYSLDTQRRVLIEREAPPTPGLATPASAAPVSVTPDLMTPAPVAPESE